MHVNRWSAKQTWWPWKHCKNACFVGFILSSSNFAVPKVVFVGFCTSKSTIELVCSSRTSSEMGSQLYFRGSVFSFGGVLVFLCVFQRKHCKTKGCMGRPMGFVPVNIGFFSQVVLLLGMICQRALPHFNFLFFFGVSLFVFLFFIFCCCFFLCLWKVWCDVGPEGPHLT